MTLHDINVQWVQCDMCDNWYHTMCEGLTPIEEVMDGNYACVNCSGWVNRSEVFIEKINQLLDEEDILNRDVVQARELCDNLKAEYTNIIGSHERSLNLALASFQCIIASFQYIIASFQYIIASFQYIIASFQYIIASFQNIIASCAHIK